MLDLILIAISVAAGGGDRAPATDEAVATLPVAPVVQTPVAEGAAAEATDLGAAATKGIAAATLPKAEGSAAGDQEGKAVVATPAENAAAVISSPSDRPTLVAEPQVPTGKFTTAVEVKPILELTTANWVAVREYGGEDLVYVTHLMAWRCGLAQMRFAVNGAELEEWPLPPCHLDTASPNAILAEDGLPYRGFALGSVDSIEIELTYDDLSTQTSRFERKAVLMP